MGDRENLFSYGIGMTRSWKLQKKCCVIRKGRRALLNCPESLCFRRFLGTNYDSVHTEGALRLQRRVLQTMGKLMTKKREVQRVKS